MNTKEMALRYLLVCVSEEAAEVVQEMAKIARFGPHHVCPVSHQTNVAKLINEVNDLYAVSEMAIQLEGAPPLCRTNSVGGRINSSASKIVRNCDIGVALLESGGTPDLSYLTEEVQAIVARSYLLTLDGSVIDGARLQRKKARIVEYLKYSVEQQMLDQEAANMIAEVANA